jgi:cold shock protein
LATGRILQFDHARGYGFVGADDDGEDVFLHASVFNGDLDELAPGTKVEFKVMAGDRGRKAFAAHLLDDEPEAHLVLPPRPAFPPGPALGSRPVTVSVPVTASVPVAASASVPSSASVASSASVPGSAPAASVDQTGTVPAPRDPEKDQGPDEQLCDVLSPAEFGQELTELLLSNVPSLTGHQVLEVRQSMLESARKHGWTDV